MVGLPFSAFSVLVFMVQSEYLLEYLNDLIIVFEDIQPILVHPKYGNVRNMPIEKEIDLLTVLF